MPSKGKGSKVAAAQARAKAAAKKKSRQGGPVLPAAAYVAPPSEADGVEDEQQERAQEVSSLSAPRRPEGTVIRTQAVRTISQRRERHAVPTLAGASLKREVSMIGGLTLLSGIVLVVLKLATDLGA